MGYIYRITNKSNGKVYIGQTRMEDPQARWAIHKRSIKWGKGGCPLLKAAMQKYGPDQFRFEVLIICFDSDLHALEKEYIQRYNSITPHGYNILAGGQSGGGFKGKKHTPETIHHIKASLQSFYDAHPGARKIQAERASKQNKIIDVGAAVKASTKFRTAVAEGRVGAAGRKCLLSEEQQAHINKRISATLKQHYHTHPCANLNIEKHRATMTNAIGSRISSYKGAALVKCYLSIADAARELGVAANSIKRALKNPDAYTCRGLSWRYAPDSGDA